MATSREFMAATGGSQIGPIEVPTDLRHLLITAVLTCRPGLPAMPADARL